MAIQFSRMVSKVSSGSGIDIHDDLQITKKTEPKGSVSRMRQTRRYRINASNSANNRSTSAGSIAPIVEIRNSVLDSPPCPA